MQKSARICCANTVMIIEKNILRISQRKEKKPKILKTIHLLVRIWFIYEEKLATKLNFLGSINVMQTIWWDPGEAAGVPAGGHMAQVHRTPGIQFCAAFHAHLYRVPQCMSPRRNWDSPNPSLASECSSPPGTKRGGGTLAWGWGVVGGVPIPVTGEKA